MLHPYFKDKRPWSFKENDVVYFEGCRRKVIAVTPGQEYDCQDCRVNLGDVVADADCAAASVAELTVAQLKAYQLKAYPGSVISHLLNDAGDAIGDANPAIDDTTAEHSLVDVGFGNAVSVVFSSLNDEVLTINMKKHMPVISPARSFNSELADYLTETGAGQMLMSFCALILDTVDRFSANQDHVLHKTLHNIKHDLGSFIAANPPQQWEILNKDSSNDWNKAITGLCAITFHLFKKKSRSIH